MKRETAKHLTTLLALAIFFLALWSLHRALENYRFSDILAEIAGFPAERVGQAAVLTILCYSALTLYDRLGLHYLGRHLGGGRILLASFTSYAVSRNVGFALLTGGSVRYRFYSKWGLPAGEVARLIAFAALSFSLGLATMGGIILLFSPEFPATIPLLPPIFLRLIGALSLAAVMGYFLLVVRRRRPFRLQGVLLSIPGYHQALGQVMVGAADWVLTASVLYALLPPTAALTLPSFLQIYLLAQLAVILSHVPGGLGVFESVILLLTPDLPAPAVFGALLVYRGVFFLLPLALAVLLFGAFEVRQRWFHR